MGFFATSADAAERRPVVLTRRELDEIPAGVVDHGGRHLSHGKDGGRLGVDVHMPERGPHPFVTFYWRPGCIFCASLRRRLLAAAVNLDERNIWEDPEAAAYVRSVGRGHETVPTVAVGDVALVNPSRSQVLAVLNGEEPPLSTPARLVRRLLGGGGQDRSA